MTRARRGTVAADAVDLSVSLGPVALRNPVVAASGTFGHGAELADLCDPATLGAVTSKSVSARPWPGNPAPRLTPAPGGGMLNSVGLQGPGVDAWLADDLPALRARGASVIASIWGRTVEEFARAATPLAAEAGNLLAVEVNVSCPNVEDRSRMFAHAPGPTRDAVAAVVGALGGALPVLAKLSPNVTDIREIAAAALDAGAAGLTLVNTLMGLAVDAERRRPVLGGGGGGLSGAPIKPVALRAVHEVWQAFPGTPIVGTGGVRGGLDAVEMMLAGASVVGVGTATFAEPRAARRVVEELAAWCAAHGVTRARDLVGALEDG